MIASATHSVTDAAPTVLVDWSPTPPDNAYPAEVARATRALCRVLVQNQNAGGGNSVFLLGDGQTDTADGFELVPGATVELTLSEAGVLSALCAAAETATVGVIATGV